MGEPTVDAALSPGTMVGAYRIEYRVGGGGMGTVYAAEEPTIKKRVAVKVMRHAFAEDATSAARFEREAQAANDVRHPGIVDVFAFGRLPDGRPYLVMSLLEGRSLRDEIAARGKLPLAECWEIARDVAEALGAAHDRGIVHRDLKPDNVFLERFGASGRARPRVLDFGLAKVTQKADESVAPMQLTQSGTPMGTPAYMAPEQWWNAGVDPRTDQYAFGVMLFEMLAGRPPFSSQQFVELVQQHLHETPGSLADVGVEVPAGVEALIARTLAKSGKDRFASMAEIIEAGDAAFLGKPVSVVKSAPIATTDSIAHGATMAVTPALSGAAAAAVRAASAEEPAEGRAGFRPFLAVFVAVMILGFGGVIGAGYAASSDGGARDVKEWFVMQGWSAFPSVFFLLLAAVIFPIAAFRRAAHGKASRGLWVLAMMPALSGGLGTYTGWHKVLEGLPQAPPTLHFTIYNIGLFEATCARFFGFAIAGVVFLQLAAMAGVFRVKGAPLERHRASVAAALALAALAGVSGALGAPSAGLIAGAAALVLGVGIALPISPGPGAARRELERALAGATAFAFAASVAFTRIDAVDSILWDTQPTRAERVREILAASAERTATVPVALASLLVLIGVEAFRLRSRVPELLAARPRAMTWVLVATLLLFAGFDLFQAGTFHRKGEQLRTAMEPQFSLFARLDPPTTDALSGKEYGPHGVPALQIARDWIAVNGTRVAKIAALESPEGAVNVGRDLSHGLASGDADAEPGSPELSVSVDREVPWSTVQRLLRIAHSSGVRRVEVLLTRGAAPVIPASAPPEAGYLLPKDFVALQAELTEEGFSAPPARRFGEIAPELVSAALASPGAPLRLSIKAP